MTTNSAKKKLFIKTYGCQMNIYDSAKMTDLLAPIGYTTTENIAEANMVILNTCHIREKASEKVYSELGKIKKIKDSRKTAGEEMLITVAGCVGQAEGEEIFKRAPFVDIVVGPQSYQTLPEMILKVNREKKGAINLEFLANDKFDTLPESLEIKGGSRFLTIQEGCDKFCKFCCVPYTRGVEFSRPVEDILREAMQILQSDVKEITLLGQNVSAYHGKGAHGEDISLAKLIEYLTSFPKLQRLRYTTSHPNDMQDDIIEAHAKFSKLMPFLHLPVQSGSNKILHDMNRKHNVEDYLNLLEKFKSARPDIAFSSDFIVGYPGETEQDFQDTLELIKKASYAQAYSFKYSMRPGTPAASMTNQIPEEIKEERLAALQALITEKQVEFNSKFIGKTIPVLFEKLGRHEGQIIGKSEYLQSVYVEAPESLIGKIINIKILAAKPNSLAGQLID